MNQRRHLLALARKGDQKAVNQLMELYQVRVYSGDSLKSMKIRKSLPVLSPPKPKETTSPSKPKPVKRHNVVAKNPKATPKVTRHAASKGVQAAKSASPKPTQTKVSPKKQTKRLKPVRKPKATLKAQPSSKKISRKVPSKGVAKKGGTRKPTSRIQVQPRTQAKSKVKAAKVKATKVKAPKVKAPKVKVPKVKAETRVKTRTQATKKATFTPASKAKRSR